MASFGNYPEYAPLDGAAAPSEFSHQFSAYPADAFAAQQAFPAAGYPFYGYPGAGIPPTFAAAPAPHPQFQTFAGAIPTAAATYNALPSAVPVAVRRPGYNERYVAWKNRQKAFSSYKKATKEAIKNARNIPSSTYALQPATTYVPQPAAYAAPAPTAAFFAPGTQFAGGYSYAPFGYQPTSFAGDFASYSEVSQGQLLGGEQQQQIIGDESEIRGTQV